MTIRRRCVRVAVGALALCAATVFGAAAAQPAGVPDVSALADVTPDYSQSASRPPGRAIAFATPDGVNCGLDGTGASATCTGALPGVADRPLTQGGDGPCDLGVASMSPAAGMMSHYKGACPGPSSGKVLDPGQKVSAGGITCGVVGDATVCTNGPHGFVLQSSESFPF